EIAETGHRALKPFRFLGHVFARLLKGQFYMAVYTLGQVLPNWLLCCNKAWLMCTESFRFPEREYPLVRIWLANESDVDDIVRVSGVSRKRVLYLLESGARCYLASAGDAPPSSINWCINGHCFIRGMGFEHDFEQDSVYGFWSLTLPEFQKRGLHFALLAERTRIERARGIRRFYGIVESHNELSFNMRTRLGFVPVATISFLRVLCLRICVVRDAQTRESSVRIFVREPRGDVVMI
ncbi:MAG: hypothetical protein JSW03_05405, partial [Candidatus Eiseniibacteriota bacterium]